MLGKNTFLYFAIILAILMIACSEGIQSTSDNPLVVESYLHVNHPFNVSVSNLAGVSPVDVDHLTLTVASDEDTVLLHANGGGIYTSDENVHVHEGTGDYTLKFYYNNEEITSLTVVPSKPIDFQLSDMEITVESISSSGFPPSGGISDESIELTWSNPNKEYYFTFFENLESNPELINNIQDTTGGNAPQLFFRGEPTQESGSEIRYRQFEYYGKYNVILFHVNADYAALYKEQESSSSLNLTSPFTNIINGLGIFTAIHSDTILLNVKKP